MWRKAEGLMVGGKSLVEDQLRGGLQPCGCWSLWRCGCWGALIRGARAEPMDVVGGVVEAKEGGLAAVGRSMVLVALF